MQGLTIEEFKKKYQEEYSKFNSNDPEISIKDGESNYNVYCRATECMVELSKKHPGENIILVTHGGVIDKIFRFIFNIPLNEKEIFRCLILPLSTFIYRDDAFFLKTWGDISHLKNLGTIDDF